jgi:hypothetical protein
MMSRSKAKKKARKKNSENTQEESLSPETQVSRVLLVAMVEAYKILHAGLLAAGEISEKAEKAGIKQAR